MEDTQAGIEELLVPIDSVKPHPRNPRVGDVKKIAVSLELNGQFRPIVVNRRDGSILAGNHTWKAAKSLGWTEIGATFVDADEDAAQRIMLADNRLAELGRYDESELLALLQDVALTAEGLAATGYTEDDLMLLIPDQGEPEHRVQGVVLGYQIIFDDEAQQTVWFEYLRWLRAHYPDQETACERLAIHLTRVMAES